MVDPGGIGWIWGELSLMEPADDMEISENGNGG